MDPEATTLGLDPASLAALLDHIATCSPAVPINRDTGRRTAALVPVFVFGFPVDMAPLLTLASEWNLTVVEGAAESLGSTYHDLNCASFGRLATLSFSGNNIIATRGGGAIGTDDAALARRAKLLSATAKGPHRWDFFRNETVYNYRLPNLNAALGVAQFEQLPQPLAAKRRLAERYAGSLAGFERAQILQEAESARSNQWLNALLINHDWVYRRHEVLSAPNDAGLMTRLIWTLMHCLPRCQARPRADLSVAEDLAARVLNLPSSANLVGKS